MTMEQKYIYDLHREQREWINRLSFYKDDIRYMHGRLAEITLKNTDHEVRAMIEHFQNQLIIRAEHLDTLRHNIKAYENVIERMIRENPVATDHRKTDDQQGLREDMNMFEKLFSELRQDLIHFVAKWM